MNSTITFTFLLHFGGLNTTKGTVLSIFTSFYGGLTFADCSLVLYFPNKKNVHLGFRVGNLHGCERAEGGNNIPGASPLVVLQMLECG